MYAVSGKRLAKDIILFFNSVLKNKELLYKPALHPDCRIFKMLQSGSQKKSWNIL
jgi:hypothetical protein